MTDQRVTASLIVDVPRHFCDAQRLFRKASVSALNGIYLARASRSNRKAWQLAFESSAGQGSSLARLLGHL